MILKFFSEILIILNFIRKYVKFNISDNLKFNELWKLCYINAPELKIMFYHEVSYRITK